MKRINFSPVTRLSGLLSVEVLVEKNVIIDAKVKGNQFRGFEWMLVGRNINDAPYFTERICGICSFAHGTASSYLLDDIFEDDIPEQAYILRNIMLALEFLQNHIRHFYIFSLPDFITLPQGIQYQGETVDRRFDERTNRRLIDSYLSAFSIAAKAHEGQTVFAGKAPHQHGIVHGGATVSPTADKIMHVKNIIHDLIEFIKERLLPDTELLERFYGDYYYMGISSSHFLSHGLFRKDKKGNTLWPGGVLTNNRYMPKIDFNSIKEDITHSSYEKTPDKDLGPAELAQPKPDKEGAYTFVKAVHYKGVPYEVGPLARAYILQGYNEYQPSTMARILTRSLETQRIAELTDKWLSMLQPETQVLKRKKKIARNEGIGLTDAPRGALLHTAKVDDKEKILEYGIITPTVWNFSPLNSYGVHGPVEEALINTFISDLDNPVEIGRIIRAFDPCLSCGTHIIRV